MIKLVLKAKHGRWTQASKQLEVVEKKPLPVESIFKFKQHSVTPFFAAVNIYQVCVACHLFNTCLGILLTNVLSRNSEFVEIDGQQIRWSVELMCVSVVVFFTKTAEKMFEEFYFKTRHTSF